jgi:hypothetical protein
MKYLSIALLSGLLAFASASTSSARRSSRHHEAGFAIPAVEAIVHPTESCSKEDDADCTEFCKLTAQTASCIAAGNKITCRCSGGKSETKCEERCLLCMPDKGALEEARGLLAMRKDL